MGGLVVYRLNLQHDRIADWLFNNTFIDALLNTSSGAYDAYP